MTDNQYHSGFTAPKYQSAACYLLDEDYERELSRISPDQPDSLSPYRAPLLAGLEETEGRRLLHALDKLKTKLQADLFGKSHQQLQRQDQATSFTLDSGRDSASDCPASRSNESSSSTTSSGGSLSPVRLPPTPPLNSSAASTTARSSRANTTAVKTGGVDMALQTELTPQISNKVSRSTETSRSLERPTISSSCPKHQHQHSSHQHHTRHQSHCQIETQRQASAAAARTISCRHYHFNFKDPLPFLPSGASSREQSHSLIAKAQGLLAARSHSSRSKSPSPLPPATVSSSTAAATTTSAKENLPMPDKTPHYQVTRRTANGPPLRQTQKIAKNQKQLTPAVNLNDSDSELSALHSELDDLLFELREEQHFIAEEIDALSLRLARAPTARLRSKLQAEVELMEGKLRTKQKQIIDLKRLCDDFVAKYNATYEPPPPPPQPTHVSSPLLSPTHRYNSNLAAAQHPTHNDRTTATVGGNSNRLTFYPLAESFATGPPVRTSTSSRSVRFAEPGRDAAPPPRWF